MRIGGNEMSMHRRRFPVVAIGLAALLAACTGGTETQLVPLSRDGMFYTAFAEAQQLATGQDKLILLEFWRPG